MIVCKMYVDHINGEKCIVTELARRGIPSGVTNVNYCDTLQNAVNFKMIVAAGGWVTFQFASEAAAETKDLYISINGGSVLYTKTQLDTAVGKTIAEAVALGTPITLESDTGPTLSQTLTIAAQR